MDCQNIVFSPRHSQKRIEKALQILPELVLKKVLFFALYLLGARMNAIASLVEMPGESGKTAIRKIMSGGIPALIDRRRSATTCDLHMPPPSPQKSRTSVIAEGDSYTITFSDSNKQLKIPQSHQVHLRSILLSLLQADLISVHTASSVLGITVAHCRNLLAKLTKKGLTETLVDKRKGQKQDFRVDSSIKAELIQQFAARAVTGHTVSSQELTSIVNDSLESSISSRTIRLHMNKLGLMKIKKTLPKLVEALKKTPKHTC